MEIHEKEGWVDKISNRSQMGGIETFISDNGPGRGSRMVWMDTGSGLRCKILPDRALDIGEAFMDAYGLAWISQRGLVGPYPGRQRGADWLRNFGGGLVTTCGLTHVGGPEKDEFGDRGLHGEISNIPAEIEQIIQPDPWSGKSEMSITGRMMQSTVFGPHIELRRTISGSIGVPEIRISDEVRNAGNVSTPHMLLYHMNFGWPLVDAGSRIIWTGKWESRDSAMDRKIFREGHDFKTCPEVSEDHAGGGEACVFIDPDTDDEDRYSFGIRNEALGLEVAVIADKSQLPALTNWQHWGRREYVTGLEPGTHHPIGQKKSREDLSLIFLEPGESRKYDLTIRVDRNKKNI